MLMTMRVSGWLANWKWWHLLVVSAAGFVMGLIAVAFLIRGNGFSQYHQAIDELAAAGFPTTGERMLKELPAIDEATQQRFRTLMPAIESLDRRAEFSGMLHEKSGLDGIIAQGVVTPRIANFLRDHAADFADLRELLREGKLVLGTAEWIRTQALSGSNDSAVLTMSLMPARQIAGFLRLAVLGGDVRALEDLEHLHACLLTACSTDLAFMSMVSDVRDECFLDLVLMGRADEAPVDRWIEEPFTAHTRLHLAIRGDIFSLCLAEQQIREFPLFDSYLPFGTVTGAWDRSIHWMTAAGSAGLDWLFLARDAGLALRWNAGIARRMEAGRGGMAVVPTERFLSPMGGMTMFATHYSVSDLLEKSVRHRAVRLAAMVVDLHRRQGRVPNDEAELLSQIGDSRRLDAMGDFPPLEYVRFDDSRFRIARNPRAKTVLVMPLPETLIEHPYTANLKTAISSMTGMATPTPHVAQRLILDSMVEIKIPLRSPTTTTSPAPPGDPPQP